MTGIAVITWAAHLGWISLENSSLKFLASAGAVAFFTLGALGEYVADKLPRTGKRTAPGPLIARIVAGGLCGSAIALAAESTGSIGAALGSVGAVIGSFGGYYSRTGLVRKFGVADIFVALPEDLVAISVAFLVILAL
jgi:uncharacterized membrane protein